MTTATAHAAAAREFKSNDGNAWRQHYPSRDCNLSPAPFTAKLTVGLIQPFKPARMVQKKINLVSAPPQRTKVATGTLFFHGKLVSCQPHARIEIREQWSPKRTDQ